MRVIAGKHRSRILAEFEKIGVRPTSDRAREALFNILQRKVPFCRFLDGFAGTGAVGIEAISRGASEVVFIDGAKESVALIQKNLATLKERAEVKQGDVVGILQRESRAYDIVFFDPPYGTTLGETALGVLSQRNLLADDGVAVLEKDGEGQEVEGLTITDVRKYGKNVFTFYIKESQ